MKSSLLNSFYTLYLRVAIDAVADISAETARPIANESDLDVDPFASDDTIDDEWLTFNKACARTILCLFVCMMYLPTYLKFLHV